MMNLELNLPAEMSASARAGEITAILAAAIVRTLLERASLKPEVSLGLLPDQRVHTTPYQEKRLS